MTGTAWTVDGYRAERIWSVPFGRRRCCSTCATRSAPATSGWRGRAATAISEKTLLSVPAVAEADRSLPVPASPHDWLAERRFALDEGLRRLAAAARADAIAGGSIEDSHAPRRKGRKPPCRTGPLT